MSNPFPSGPILTPSLATLAERVYATAYEALERDDIQSAERFFGLLAILAPRDERAWVGLAVARERRGDLPMAAARYLLGSGIVPESTWCHLGRARTLRQLGQSVESEEAFDEAEASTTDTALLGLIQYERTSP